MSISAGEWIADCWYYRLLLEAGNATPSDSVDIAKELALHNKDVDIPHLKIELQILPDLVKPTMRVTKNLFSYQCSHYHRVSRLYK